LLTSSVSSLTVTNNNNYSNIRDLQKKMEQITKKIEEIDWAVKVKLNLKQFLSEIKKR
jgi:hypothetical protein